MAGSRLLPSRLRAPSPRLSSRKLRPERKAIIQEAVNEGHPSAVAAKDLEDFVGKRGSRGSVMRGMTHERADDNAALDGQEIAALQAREAQAADLAELGAGGPDATTIAARGGLASA